MIFQLRVIDLDLLYFVRHLFSDIKYVNVLENYRCKVLSSPLKILKVPIDNK